MKSVVGWSLLGVAWAAGSAWAQEEQHEGHGHEHHGDAEDGRQSTAQGDRVFLGWELLQAEVKDDRQAKKLAAHLLGLSGPDAAYHTMYGVCLARMAGVIADDATTQLIHQPGVGGAYAGGEGTRAREISVNLDWDKAAEEATTVDWKVEWTAFGKDLVDTSGALPLEMTRHQVVPLSTVTDGVFLLATVGLREQARNFAPPMASQQASATAFKSCQEGISWSDGEKKRAFRQWLQDRPTATLAR